MGSKAAARGLAVHAIVRATGRLTTATGLALLPLRAIISVMVDKDTQPQDDELLRVNITVRRRHLRWLLVGGGILALLLIMAATNPTEEDFRRQFEAEVRSRAQLTKQAGDEIRAFLSPLITRAQFTFQCERTNCVFFSVFSWTNPDGKKLSFPGAFGRVWGFALQERR